MDSAALCYNVGHLNLFPNNVNRHNTFLYVVAGRRAVVGGGGGGGLDIST